LYSLSGERYENKTQLDFPNSFEEDDPSFYISGSDSINGILCLISNSEPKNRVVLWNPTTKEFKVIPISLSELVPYMNVKIDQYGFGYDSVNDDYKVIQLALCHPKRDCVVDFSSLGDISFGPSWEIYSLRTNSWRKLYFDIPINYDVQGVFLDGMCHWCGENEDFFDEDYPLYLLSFDLSNEVFLTTLISSEEDESLDIESAKNGLAVLNGYVALISNYTESNTFHISILGEIDVKKIMDYSSLFVISILC
jgi:molecular chaperone HtpG